MKITSTAQSLKSNGRKTKRVNSLNFITKSVTNGPTLLSIFQASMILDNKKVRQLCKKPFLLKAKKSIEKT